MSSRYLYVVDLSYGYDGYDGYDTVSHHLSEEGAYCAMEKAYHRFLWNIAVDMIDRAAWKKIYQRSDSKGRKPTCEESSDSETP